MSQNCFNNYYEDLQVSSNADIETIERVYRLLAKRYHPDWGGDSEKFIELMDVYEKLTDD